MIDPDDVCCCVPFFGGDPFRLGNLERVLAHLRDAFGDNVFVEEGESQAQARNQIKWSRDFVLYFNDADSLVPHDQIREACELAGAEPGLVFAYTDYIRLDPEGVPCEHIAGSGSSGAVAISRQCFEEVGGYDERFTGWGYEDLDFARRCAARWPIRRVPGELRHLWHPPAGGRSEAERDLPVTHEQMKNLQLYESLVALDG